MNNQQRRPSALSYVRLCSVTKYFVSFLAKLSIFSAVLEIHFMHCFPHVNTASGVAPLTSCQHWVSRCRTEMSHGHDNTHKHCCCRVTGLGHRNGITGEESWGLHFYIDTVFCVEYTVSISCLYSMLGCLSANVF